jgi:putative FmdB family regulatory protein
VAIYEYECKVCKIVSEISHPMNDTPNIVCIVCDVPKVKKLSLGATIFRGSGWGKD